MLGQDHLSQHWVVRHVKGFPEVVLLENRPWRLPNLGENLPLPMDLSLLHSKQLPFHLLRLLNIN